MCGRSQSWAVIGLWVQRVAKHLASKLTAVGYGTLAPPTTLRTFLLKTRTNQTEMDIRAVWIPFLYPCSLLFESRGSAHLFTHSMKWTKCNIFVEWAVGVRVERVLVKLLSTQAPLSSRWHFQQHPASFSHVPVFPRSTARLTASLMRAQSVSTIHTCAPQAGRLACKLMPWTHLFFFIHKYTFMCGESRKWSECVQRQALNWYSYRALTFTAAYCFQSRLFFLYSPKKKKEDKIRHNIKIRVQYFTGISRICRKRLADQFQGSPLSKILHLNY